MLTLPEEILLLSLDEEKGSIRRPVSFYINQVMVGAMLLELAVQKRIAFLDNNLIVKNGEGASSLLRVVLDELQKSKPQNLAHWFAHFTMKAGKLFKPVYQELVEKRVLKMEVKRMLGLFPIKHYPVKDKKKKRILCARIESVVFRRKEVDTRTLCLLCLIQACNLFRALYDKEKSREAKARSKEILEKENAHLGIESSFPNSIEQQVHAAIQRTILIVHIATGE